MADTKNFTPDSFPPEHFGRVAIIGLGLIGSSLARGLKAAGAVSEIVGHARSAATRDKALELGFVDRVETLPEDAAKDADIVVIAAPVGVTADIVKAIAANLKPGAIVTDVGSVKEAVVTACAPHIPAGVHLVPGHPVAGTEESGPESGFAELFQQRWCILTPPEGTDDAAVAHISDMWRAVGSQVDTMAPNHHDMVLAITSHLPHLIAFTIVGTATELENQLQKEVIKFAAGGFRDFTRIAASDPVMWRDIFLANKDAVLEMLGRFDEDLTALQRAIRYGDGDALEEMFARTRDIRRSIVDAGQA
ncbi:MAG: prephenate/arogenate dehydrogenase family protein [Rhodospirillales bacterium]|nr:prephenate/arogenate dehydrogenase family protein [Rhodospirillales bacterium]